MTFYLSIRVFHSLCQLESSIKNIILRRGLRHRLQDNNTAVLADTLDFETLSIHDFAGSLLTPARVVEALLAGKIDYFIWAATKKVLDSSSSRRKKLYASHYRDSFVSKVIEQVFLELAQAIGDRVAGPYVVLVDPRKHGDMSSMVKDALRLHGAFTRQGVPRGSIIVTIPATEAGILAAQSLQKENVYTNLYLVTSLLHAQACAEAKVQAISVSIGPLLEMHERRLKCVYQKLNDNPGLETMQSILAYFRINGIKTKIIGMNFRNVAEIGVLSDCDAVCVSAEQAEEMKWSRAPTAASIHSKEEPQFVLRARQAKYPTDLLTRQGGFSKWFSPGTRSMTVDLLSTALAEMQDQMNTLESVVETEILRRLELEKDLREIIKSCSSDLTRHSGSADGTEQILSPSLNDVF